MNKVVLPKKAFKYIFIFILIGSLAIGVYFLLKYIGEKKQKENFETLILRDNKKELTKNLLKAVNELKDENGRYPIHIDCNKATTECTTIYSNHEGPVAVWTLYKAYKKYGDVEFLVALRKDLENYTNREKFPVFQNIFWNCSLLEEIILDEEIESDIREGARELCFKGVENPNLSISYDGSNDYTKNILEKIGSGELNISSSGGKSVPLSEKESEVEALSVYSSEYLAKSNLNTEENLKKDNLNQAYYFIDEAYKRYVSEVNKGKYFSEGTKCLLGNATMDLYLINNDKVYLDIASVFYNVDDVYEGKILRDKAICKRLYKKLYKEYSYLDVYNKDLDISKSILENQYDVEGGNAFLYGKNLLYSDYGDKAFYDVRYGNLFLGMYLDENK